MIKLLFLTSRLRRCGPNNQLLNIISNLNSSLFSATVLTLSPEPGDSMIAEFRDRDIAIEGLDLGRIEGVLRGGGVLRRKLNDYMPDLIHTQEVRSDFLSLLTAAKFPRVVTVRNDPCRDYVMKYGRLKGKLLAQFHLSVLRRMPVNVACSETIAEALEGYGVRAVAIQNGVDQDRFHPASPVEKAHLRRKLELPPKARIWISVGSLIARKDPLMIAQGFSMLNPSPSSEQLLFLGDGPMRNELAKVTETCPSIRLLGQVEAVEDYLRAADVFISSSTSEGLPNTVLEAMSCGLPVLLSDIPSHREILRGAGRGVSLFGVGQANQLGEILWNLDAKWIEEAGAAAAESITSHFGARSMSRRYQELYCSLLKRGN